MRWLPRRAPGSVHTAVAFCCRFPSSPSSATTRPSALVPLNAAAVRAIIQSCKVQWPLSAQFPLELHRTPSRRTVSHGRHTSAPGLRSPLPHLRRDWAHPCRICTGTALTPATSAPGLGSPLPHLHRLRPRQICMRCRGRAARQDVKISTKAGRVIKPKNAIDPAVDHPEQVRGYPAGFRRAAAKALSTDRRSGAGGRATTGTSSPTRTT